MLRINVCSWPAAAMGLVLASAALCPAALWQYRVDYDRGTDRAGKPNEPGSAMLWMPPKSATLRGLVIVGQLGIEGDFERDQQVRKACEETDIGLIYFTPHIAAVFKFWEAGNTEGERFLKALDDLAKRSGHAEVRRVPWITAGHSTAGIYCRNVAYWRSERVAGIFQIKSGNFFQPDQVPPTGSLVGIPYVALNGQYEWFGPATVEQPDPKDGRIDERYGHETQWIYVQNDIQKLRKKDANYLMADLVEPTANHYDGTLEDAAYFALFLRKTAQYRLPKTLPAGDGLIKPLAMKAEDGWLTDPDLKNSANPPAAYADYKGDKSLAMWHYDKEIAEANVKFHANLGKLQWIGNAKATWLDEGDGWSFKVDAAWLDKVPEWVRGKTAGEAITHAQTPFTFRCRPYSPIVQTGPDTFRLVRSLGRKEGVSFAVYHPGDGTHSSAIEWGKIEVPAPAKDAAKQDIAFAKPADVKADSAGVELAAKASSGLPVYYEVNYGPVAAEDGKLVISELPANAQFPIECKVTAHQVGRRVGKAVAPATPVSVVFNVTRP